MSTENQRTVDVCSSHGVYECDSDGNVLSETLHPGGDHKPGERVRFEWPDDGEVVPADEDYLRDVYYAD